MPNFGHITSTDDTVSMILKKILILRNVTIPLDEDSLRPRCSASMLSRLLFNVGFYSCRRTATDSTDSRAAALLLLRTTVFWTTAVRHTGVGTITYGSENAARSIKNAECARVALTLSRGRSPWCTGLVVVYSRSFSIGFFFFFRTPLVLPPHRGNRFWVSMGVSGSVRSHRKIFHVGQDRVSIVFTRTRSIGTSCTLIDQTIFKRRNCSSKQYIPHW